jgi:hypothetical protein
MAEEAKKSGDGGQTNRSAGGFGAAIVRKAVEPIATAAATAGAAYLTRKSSEVWRQRVAPKVREQGGARAAVENAVKRASETVGAGGSTAISALTERGFSAVSAVTGRLSDVRERYSGVALAGLQAKPKGQREDERRERQRRRNERQRALKRSGSS